MIKLNKQLLFNCLIGACFVWFVAVLLNPERVKQTFKIDSCMAEGGQWDYINKVCEGNK